MSKVDSRDEEFAEFFDTHDDKLVKTIWAWTSDQHLAEDVAQEVMITIRHYWGRYNRPEVLMYQLAKQELSKRPKTNSVPVQVAEEHLREARRRASTEVHDQTMDGVDSYLDLIRALQGLPIRQRETVVLCVMCDLECSEVAQILGIGESAVKTHKKRGLTRLEVIMQGWIMSTVPGSGQPVGGA